MTITVVLRVNLVKCVGVFQCGVRQHAQGYTGVKCAGVFQCVVRQHAQSYTGVKEPRTDVTIV